jgi:hypothetical protein
MCLINSALVGKRTLTFFKESLNLPGIFRIEPNSDNAVPVKAA